MSTYPKIHISITVSDLSEGISFYKSFLGADPVKVEPGYAKFLPDFAPLNLAIQTAGNHTSEKSSVSHFGIQVEDQDTVMTHLSRIKAGGLEVLEEMNVDCCYANQDKFWVSDPEGNRWEIYVLNRDVDTMGHSAATACCSEAEAVPSDSETCCEPSCCS